MSSRSTESVTWLVLAAFAGALWFDESGAVWTAACWTAAAALIVRVVGWAAAREVAGPLPRPRGLPGRLLFWSLITLAHVGVGLVLTMEVIDALGAGLALLALTLVHTLLEGSPRLRAWRRDSPERGGSWRLAAGLSAAASVLLGTQLLAGALAAAMLGLQLTDGGGLVALDPLESAALVTTGALLLHGQAAMIFLVLDEIRRPVRLDKAS